MTMEVATKTKEAAKSGSNGMTAVEQRHLGALEKRIAAGLQVFREVGVALLEIRDQRLYRNTHPTFEAYCAERWGLPRARAYQVMEAAQVDKVLGSPKDLLNEAQARELAKLTDDPAKAKKVWQAVRDRAEETHKPVTANLIRQVRGEILDGNDPNHPVVEQTATDRLLQDIIRLGNAYARWKESRPNVGERQKVSAAIRRFITEFQAKPEPVKAKG